MADSESFDAFFSRRVALRRVVSDGAFFCSSSLSPQTVHRQHVITKALHV